MMKRTLFSSAALVLFASLVMACGGPHYDHTTVTDVAAGELPATVSLSSVSIAVGGATKAVITPYNDDDKTMAIDVSSDSPGTLEIAPGIGANEFVFMGRSVGKTTVRFLADGQVVASANAEVTPQTGP